MGRSRNGSSEIAPLPAQNRPTRLDHVQCQVDLLASQFPEVHEQIITLLANGHSPAKVKLWTGIDSDVVRRIRELHPETLERIKANLAANLAEAATTLSERLIAAAPRLRPENIAKALAIAVDKHQLLSGGVTARTEHRRAPTPEELQAMFESLPKANAVVIEDTKEETSDGHLRHPGS
jgi:hypothetical protein